MSNVMIVTVKVTVMIMAPLPVANETELIAAQTGHVLTSLIFLYQHATLPTFTELVEDILKVSLTFTTVLRQLAFAAILFRAKIAFEDIFSI
jgi:hypothetical protein